MNFKFWKKDKLEERSYGNFDFLTYGSFVWKLYVTLHSLICGI